MTSLNFSEDVEVQLSSTDNINYSYQNGYLVLLCKEFTGCIVLKGAEEDNAPSSSPNRPAVESMSPPTNTDSSPQQRPPPPVPVTPRQGLSQSQLGHSQQRDDSRDDSVATNATKESAAELAKKERIALLRKMVSSKGSSLPHSRKSSSVPRSPRPGSSQYESQSPPDTNRRSIFESGAEPKKAPAAGEQFSFKPTINAHSKEILASKGGDSSVPAYEALYQKKNDKERRRKRAQEEQLTKEMADCTFQPNVNDRTRSKTLPTRRETHSDETSIVQRAESWSKRRDADLKSKREEQARREKEACTFKPGIHGVDKGLLRSQTQSSPGYDEFIQRQVTARQAREELSKVPHVTGENWTGKGTKVKTFKFNNRDQDRKELRSNIRSLQKPTSVTLGEDDQDYDASAVSSPEDEFLQAEKQSEQILLHEIVAMQWYYVDKSKQMQGPMSVSKLTKDWNEKLVDENSYVWAQGMVDWVKAKDMPDLLLVLTHSGKHPGM